MSAKVRSRSLRPGGRPNAGRIACALAFVLMAGCSSAEAQDPDVDPVGPLADPPAEVQDLLDRLEEARVEQERIQAELQALAAADLVARLDEESRAGFESFNSLAFREIERRGEEIAQELARVIQAQDRPSFLGILALRSVNRPAYREADSALVVEILVADLQGTEYFNAWGLPHLYWDVAGAALIEQGREALPALEALLGDERRAPVYGSEEAIESERYQYRLNDYAFALILAIQGEPTDLPTDPSERDQLIQDYVDRA